MNNNDYTGLLYAQPSMLEGIARTLDIGGVFDDYNFSAGPQEADAAATASDWYAVGAALNSAIKGFVTKVRGQEFHARSTRS